MKRAHPMPFGTEVLPSGEVRFRLWAPAAERVDLRLAGPGGERELPMEDAGDGWFEGRSAQAGAGSRYRYRVDGRTLAPDPAARFQPEGVHAASEVVDPSGFEWSDGDWRGRPWTEAVLYELHVGAFSPEGSYDGVRARLDALAEVGVTALELMPLSDCPGARNWGYDGVLPFAPAARYGRPEALKHLVAEAHARGLMVLLDVVYNHFGPEGNYLPGYAPGFFTDRHATPWGAAIDFEGPGPVREFFIHNALYWLEEFHLDGLRLDAVHAIHDASEPDLLSELADRVRRGPGAHRDVHLVLENDANEARRLGRDARGRPLGYTAQWNDDAHHALHVLLTGERDGYYADYAERPVELLGRCLAEGFAWQGEPSPHRGGARRGEPSAALPPDAFVAFLQNHDQIGNRAFGERLVSLAPPEAVEAGLAVLLLAPWTPLLFMGEEWGAEEPFLFFCDFAGRLADQVREGRRADFAGFRAFASEEARSRIPSPGDASTFERSVLGWEARRRPEGRARLARVQQLLALRARQVTPRLEPGARVPCRIDVLGPTALAARWELADGARLELFANLGDAGAESALPDPACRLWASPHVGEESRLPPWSVVWRIAEKGAR